MPEWTAQQQQAINRRDGSLLVSAAAGSGKTAVLATRTVEYVKNGGSLSRLLIVTFTRLAASEMKRRIADILAAEYAAHPTEHLKRERLGVYGARISTIDSFYASLLRQNFQKLGLSPDFSVIPESEYADIKTACLEKQLEEYYGSYKNDFAELLKLFGGEQNSDSVAKAVNSLYSFLRSVPFPDKWMDKQLERYLDTSFYTDMACEREAELAGSFEKLWLGFLSELPFSDKDMLKVNAEYGFIHNLRKRLNAHDWDGACAEVTAYEMQKSPTCKSGDKASQKYKYYRGLLKESFLSQQIFMIDSASAEEDNKRLYTQIKALFEFVREYSAAVEAEFRKKNRYSFDFISQAALSLLVESYDYNTGEFTRTLLAEELSSSFDEIMIDEYQDVNDVQDLFFRAVSRDGGEKGVGGNLFAVGDVKQSIYRFRHANPRNFMRRAADVNVIFLNRNFRSRSGILDFTNYIFEGLFSDECCGLEYGEDEKLVCGRKTPPDRGDVEYIVAEPTDEEDKTAVQASAAAVRIKELLSSGYRIYDKDSGGERLLRQGDIALLLRSPRDIATVYEKTFRDAGLSVGATGLSSFWSSVEVNTVTALLNVIDNPYDDLSLFAVMFSDIYGFGAEKTARIKLCARKSPLYDACRAYRDKTGDSDCEKLLGDLDRYYLLSKNYTPDSLIRQIYADTRYPDRVSCLENGYLRRENLMRLYDFASGWAANTGGSLYGFLSYAAVARENAAAKPEPSAASPDSVRIMSVHASKGLEFPVCILAQADSGINMRDMWNSIVFCDEKDGIAAMIRDPDMIYQTTTLQREVLRLGEKKNLIAEEMRVLYVAMTRAREKLIILSSGSDTSENKLKVYASMGGEALLPAVRLLLAGSLSYEDMLLLRLVHHPDGGELRSEFSGIAASDGLFTFRRITERAQEETSQAEQESIKLTELELIRRISAEKGSLLADVPAKLSVTELVKGSYRDEEGRQLIQLEATVKTPSFITGKTLSPTQRGTAMHTFMRFASFAADVESDIVRLESEGYLSKEEAACLSRRKLRGFMNGSIIELMKGAEEVRREEEFVARLPASLYDRRVKNGASLLVQGAIDLLIKKNGGLIIVDYKTDSATSGELIERYVKQLFLYKLAAEEVFGLPVKGVYIWSFSSSEAIDCLPYMPALNI